MDQKQRKEIKKIIKEEIAKTEAKISEYKQQSQPVEPENAIGRISRMDAINNKSVVEAALRKAEEKLKKLDYALSQVDKEGFGICTRCKNPIPSGRILLMPQSVHCVKCAR